MQPIERDLNVANFRIYLAMGRTKRSPIDHIVVLELQKRITIEPRATHIRRAINEVQKTP